MNVSSAFTTTTSSMIIRRLGSTSSRRTTASINSGVFQSHPFFLSSSSSLNRNYVRSLHATTAASSNNQENNQNNNKNTTKNNKNNNKKKSSKKIKLRNENDADVDALTAAFDKMAKAEGFDESTALYTDSDTFDDDFDYDNIEFADGDDDDEDDDDDDFLDFGGGGDNGEGGIEESMEERIAAAQRDMDLGRVSATNELKKFSRDVTAEDMKKLGFEHEVNPYGNDETSRKEQFTLLTNAMTCPACGADFQTRDEMKPGYLPQDKYEIQTKLRKIEEAQRVQEKAESPDWSTDDEIEWLLQEAGGATSDADGEIDIHAMAEEMGIDLVELSQKKVICKRCHGLQNSGEVPENLRPGWTDEPMLSQQGFRDLLLPLREKPAVLIALVDLFDFSGSVLPELDAIAGENPVIVAANKADLLPSNMGPARAENWVRRELEYIGIQSLANVGGAVRLVSCKTGFGVTQMLDKARSIAEDMDCDIYIVGAANAGKSTLVNHLIAKSEDRAKKFRGKKRAGNANARKGAVTTSPLPGTTLKFIKIDLAGRNLYDTPGLLVPGTLTQRLTPAELKMVVPKKPIEPVTFRVSSGKCVLIGGLAKIEVIGDTKPFLFTFFISNDVKLHPTDSTKADDFRIKHAGKMLTPPLEPGQERIEEIGEMEYHEVDIEGCGWKEAAADISLQGLGWVAVTGAGVAKVRIGVPRDVGVSVRPPLMPFDIWEVAAKYTGGRATRKTGKTKYGKKRRGVGRR